MRSSGYCLWLFILLYATQGCSSAEERHGGTGSPAGELAAYSEAVAKIRAYAIFVDPNERKKAIIGQTIRAYLHQADPYSDYLTPEQYAAFKQGQKRNEVGLGLNIEKGAHGEIVCFPVPAGPAELAGVRAGDRLEAIDGVPVPGRSVFAVAAMARAAGGRTVTLTIGSPNGQTRSLAVTRSTLGMQSVSSRPQGGFTVIRIAAFTSATPGELERALKQAGRSVLVVDLRGNGGGELLPAIDSARQFLKKGSRAVLVRMRSGVKSYDTAYDGPASGSRLFLWQDGRTASAAEVFVAALTGNGRAVSIGERSYGKGSRQDVMALSDGSALVLTTGILETPGGVAYDGKGIAPSYPVQPAAANDAGYLAVTKQLIQQTKRD